MSAFESLHSILEDFIAGPDRSLSAAGRIEVALDEAFPDDVDIQEFVTYFALYRPSGGDYLYDESQMVAKSIELLALIIRKKS